MSQEQAALGEPRRIRWSVPPEDTSVIQWLEQQHSISQSLRVLIRDSIERDGYVDAVFRPVRQLPRRGRPPGSVNTLSAAEDDEIAQGAADIEQVPPSQPAAARAHALAHTDKTVAASVDTAADDTVPAANDAENTEQQPEATPEAKRDDPPGIGGLDAFLTH